MDKQQGMEIVTRLRQAAAAGAPVVELLGTEAKSFVFVKDRAIVLGSFRIEQGAKFFVSIASSPTSTESFQMLIYEKQKGNPVLASSTFDSTGIVWTYEASKQDGGNQLRKKAFLEAANAESLTFPLPDSDVIAFSDVIHRAIELRTLAHAAGGEIDDGEAGASGILEKLYANSDDRFAAAFALSRSIRRAHELNAKSWCVTNPGAAGKIRLNVGVLRVMDLMPGAVKLIVDPDKVPSDVRASLGDAFEMGDPSAKTPYAKVVLDASKMPSLAPEILFAHDDFLTRAANTSSPFAGLHHQAAIIEAVEAVIGAPLPKPASGHARYWKVSPGENGEMWDECRVGAFIAVGWDELGDLTNVNHDTFKQRAEELDASAQVWKFRNIEVGDRIVANNGTTRVLGIGTVTGPYFYAAGARRSHRLPVRWYDTEERKVDMKGWRSTLIRLKQDTFKDIESTPPFALLRQGVDNMNAPPTGVRDEEAGPEGGIDFDGILSELSSKSLSFSAEVVASYLLALQAKRFVLLTGISGTGKTRLAQEIARMFGPIAESALAVNPEPLEIVAKPSQLKYARFIVPSVLAQEFDALTNPESKRIDLKVPGLPPASMAFHKAPERGNLMYVLLSGATKEWFLANIKVDGRFLLSKKMTGDREWLDLALPTESRPPPALPTYELIAVRPDWTDARALLGFYNPLTKSYLATPTLRLLLRAHAEVQAATNGPPRPFFLIFDEMNLARVEHYFSDFLSVMESGEAIHLHDDPQVEEEEDVPRRISIPKNVFVIGTVNVDETTYMFSPKVLDRAFVLEFNDVHLDGLSGPVQSEASESTPLALVNLEGGLKLRGQGSGDEWKRFEGLLGGEVRELFGKLHHALAIENRHFGYRVAREIARFVDLAVEQAGTSEATVRAALDVAVLAKILPKLHGSQAEIEATLKRLIAIATGDKPEGDVFTAHGGVIEGVEIPLPRTTRKLGRMLRRLRANGFVSFIE
jgi:5-methylcytosine-specific restriction enzyme B